MKIASVIGTRPNFVKAAPVSRALRKKFDELIVHTGQHYDYEMDKIFFDELQIPVPDYHLGVGSGLHGFQTGEIMKKVENVFVEEKPDLVLVYGDCNSTLAGALVASKLHIKVAHIEAGLRSFDSNMPEEINRALADHCSDLLFCPTKTAVNNLAREGLTKGVYLTGDVMVDALLHNKDISAQSKIIEELGLKSKQYIVATVHRQSNTDNKENLKSIAAAFCELSERIIFPMHPRTEKFLKRYGLFDDLRKKVNIIKPLGHLDFLKLINNAKKIITDSGGLQKEAYILKVPCITIRDNTEWVETVEDGWNVLVGADKGKIIEIGNTFAPKRKQRHVFGDGCASEKIVKIIENVRAGVCVECGER